MKLNEIDTPAVLIDTDRAEANLQKFQTYADNHSLTVRPHIKTHKLPRFAKRAIELGAIGITCQKLGEAEVMADAGLTDIFVPYNIIGKAKLERLIKLNERITISVTADNETAIRGYSEAFAGRDKPLTVLVECDTGMGRCGVQTPQEALLLAKLIHKSEGLIFAGFMTYPKTGAVEANEAFLAEAEKLAIAAGLDPRIVSNGGSPDMWRAHEVKSATEHRPGTYIYMDRFQVAKGAGTWDDCALTVLATVVSRPTENRAVVDAGSKVLSSDTFGMDGFGKIVEYPDAIISSLSEEHGTIDVTSSKEKPKVGDRIRIIPNHACVVSNLFDSVILISGDTVVEIAPVAARGRVD
ncbi:D-TA family PLP-dependent enzyme [Phyllobacterium sp. YR531]|uniref:D-TA family PLP-dependent enzyme n=1 Tax=Phyllobacterium sp. YR531 TaxID=1144343 RepID=UPI00026FBB32|nr:D-TA family PLP-dependent enzyme [Phyllobacterium sp. YR531]EJN02331.1 putative amino acid aldolase or racemase [Phyllobacterium sp. YR531]